MQFPNFKLCNKCRREHNKNDNQRHDHGWSLNFRLSFRLWKVDWHPITSTQSGKQCSKTQTEGQIKCGARNTASDCHLSVASSRNSHQGKEITYSVAPRDDRQAKQARIDLGQISKQSEGVNQQICQHVYPYHWHQKCGDLIEFHDFRWRLGVSCCHKSDSSTHQNCKSVTKSLVNIENIKGYKQIINNLLKFEKEEDNKIR